MNPYTFQANAIEVGLDTEESKIYAWLEGNNIRLWSETNKIYFNNDDYINCNVYLWT